MKCLLIVITCIVTCCKLALGSDADKSWNLSTDDTALTVTVQQGITVITQLSSAKGGSKWLFAPVPEILLPSVTQQGSSLTTKWQYEGGAFDPESGQLVLRF